MRQLQNRIQALEQVVQAKERQPAEIKTVITVRLPQLLHYQLKAEAHSRHLSLNELCVQKLEHNLPPKEETITCPPDTP